MKLENLNFTLPEGTTNHGDPHLLCFPARWNDIAVFIIVNYVAHAATVKTPPASSPFATAWVMLGSLLLPVTGLTLGLSAFYQAWKGFKQSSLQKATLARALCMYVRADDWYNEPCSNSRTLQIKAAVDTSPFGELPVVSRVWLLLYLISRKGSSLLWSLPALIILYFTISLDWAALFLFYKMNAVDKIHGRHSERMQSASEDVSISDRYVEEGLYMANLSPISPSTSTVVGQSGSQQPIETAVIFTIRATDLVNPGSEIYGQCPSVPGYVLARVPMASIVEPVAEPCDGLRTLELLSKRRNATKSLLAFIQLCFSVFVLVRARGNQVDLYSAGGFSLSVAPYAVMAAVNLLANALVPQYDCLFLVENDVMEEIRLQHDLQFHGIVGKVLQTEKGGPVTLHLPGKEDGSQKWVSGIPGFQQDTRLRLLTPDEAISDGVLPDIFIFVSATHEVQRQARLSNYKALLVDLINTIICFSPLAIIEGISPFHLPTENSTVAHVALFLWIYGQQLLGLFLAFFLLRGRGVAALPAPIL
ncbi:hypothetical protein MAJ_07636, partial [Metarhizium majus ARSEF 297]